MQLPSSTRTRSKDCGIDSGQRADHGSREHRSHRRITGNATITGATGSGVSASRDRSEDTFFSKTLKCHASNGVMYTVTFKRDSISLTSYDADSIRTTLETCAEGIAAFINTRFSCIIRGPDAPVRSPAWPVYHAGYLMLFIPVTALFW